MKLAKTLLRAAANRAGGVLLSSGAYSRLRATRAAAIAQLTESELPTLKPGLTGVVFSKDRALQLHALLHSYFQLTENPAPLTVIFHSSTPAHAKAYAEVQTLFKKSPTKVEFVLETAKFRQMLSDVLAAITTRNIFFLVDDIVFIRPLNLKLAAQINPLEAVLSLRLSPHMRRSYTANMAQKPPHFTPSSHKGLLEFPWFQQGNEWSYPYSVDGHIFSTAEIRVLTRLATFKAPNTYEGALMEFADLCESRTGLCYAESKILNLPLNRVQSEVANISGNITPQTLLEAWQNGQMLDFSPLLTHTPTAPHEDHPLRLIPRTEGKK